MDAVAFTRSHNAWRSFTSCDRCGCHCDWGKLAFGSLSLFLSREFGERMRAGSMFETTDDCAGARRGMRRYFEHAAADRLQPAREATQCTELLKWMLDGSDKHRNVCRVNILLSSFLFEQHFHSKSRQNCRYFEILCDYKLDWRWKWWEIDELFRSTTKLNMLLASFTKIWGHRGPEFI